MLASKDYTGYRVKRMRQVKSDAHIMNGGRAGKHSSPAGNEEREDHLWSLEERPSVRTWLNGRGEWPPVETQRCIFVYDISASREQTTEHESLFVGERKLVIFVHVKRQGSGSQ